MNCRKVIEGQIKELQRRQEGAKDKKLRIEDCLKISKIISELAVMASKLPSEK
ncbi:hypothetical protein [Clostridium sporogenes]|uniref:hypothetical protein n=1 Tax=Clostridium sporogenes TaxID=1509 RepID=UPI0013D2D3B4|nr:hypothetical protein [Clostridium sporogenes]